MSTSISNLLSSGTGTGLGQGIDVQQFVQLALAGDQANITALQNQQTALASQERSHLRHTPGKICPGACRVAPAIS